jgi:hypothetical protein
VDQGVVKQRRVVAKDSAFKQFAVVGGDYHVCGIEHVRSFQKTVQSSKFSVNMSDKLIVPEPPFSDERVRFAGGKEVGLLGDRVPAVVEAAYEFFSRAIRIMGRVKMKIAQERSRRIDDKFLNAIDRLFEGEVGSRRLLARNSSRVVIFEGPEDSSLGMINLHSIDQRQEERAWKPFALLDSSDKVGAAVSCVLVSWKKIIPR